VIILAGDIGGTNTRLIAEEINSDGRRILAEKIYYSADSSDLIPVINIFLSEHDISEPVYAACFAVAGPVVAGSASVTNLPWVISEDVLAKALDTPRIKLINDFVAISYGIPELDDTDLLLIRQGEVSNDMPANHDAVIIGAGTGLGASHLVWQSDHYQPYASEAGHAGFAPENTLQSELLAWLQKQYKHVSLETLLSGKGLITIYHFLRDVVGLSESLLIKEEMQETDPAQVITAYALSGSDELCQKTLDCFVEIYGAAAGNIALHYYPVGELYIAGGIAGKIKDKILSRNFIDAFLSKGAMSSNMEKITLKLIMQAKVGLYGALSNARALYC